MKRLVKAVSFVIYNDSEILLVLRPENDELGGIWGLPATTLESKETFEEAAIRCGREKLGIELKIKRFIGDKTIERTDYLLYMKLFEAEIVSGVPIAKPKPKKSSATYYEAVKWGNPYELEEALEKGSLCCNIYFEMENEKQSKKIKGIYN